MGSKVPGYTIVCARIYKLLEAYTSLSEQTNHVMVGARRVGNKLLQQFSLSVSEVTGYQLRNLSRSLHRSIFRQIAPLDEPIEAGINQASSGGSINTTSQFFDSSGACKASPQKTEARSVAPSCSISWFNDRQPRALLSTKRQLLAPRDSASNPKAPEPANRSTHDAPLMAGVSQLNRVSRTRSDVGRRPSQSDTGSLRPRHWPPIMRTWP